MFFHKKFLNHIVEQMKIMVTTSWWQVTTKPREIYISQMFVSRLIQGVGDQNMLSRSLPQGYGTHYVRLFKEQ